MLDPGLLEELPVAWQRALRRKIDLTELTQVSLVLSPRTGLVITNHAFYVIRERWMGGPGCQRIPRSDVQGARVEGDCFYLLVQGQEQQLPLAVNKKGQARQVAGWIKKLRGREE